MVIFCESAAVQRMMLESRTTVVDSIEYRMTDGLIFVLHRSSFSDEIKLESTKTVVHSRANSVPSLPLCNKTSGHRDRVR